MNLFVLFQHVFFRSVASRSFAKHSQFQLGATFMYIVPIPNTMEGNWPGVVEVIDSIIQKCSKVFLVEVKVQAQTV
jgi:hypothetical protein